MRLVLYPLCALVFLAAGCSGPEERSASRVEPWDPSAPEAAPVPEAAEEPAPAVEKAKALACPMHPEVTSDVPAKCPECGMELEPVEEVGK